MTIYNNYFSNWIIKINAIYVSYILELSHNNVAIRPFRILDMISFVFSLTNYDIGDGRCRMCQYLHTYIPIYGYDRKKVNNVFIETVILLRLSTFIIIKCFLYVKRWRIRTVTHVNIIIFISRGLLFLESSEQQYDNVNLPGKHYTVCNCR